MPSLQSDKSPGTQRFKMALPRAAMAQRNRTTATALLIRVLSPARALAYWLTLIPAPSAHENSPISGRPWQRLAIFTTRFDQRVVRCQTDGAGRTLLTRPSLCPSASTCGGPAGRKSESGHVAALRTPAACSLSRYSMKGRCLL